MMNLKTMVTGLSNDTVALNLIKHWSHDDGTLRFWRASTNFVYVFEQQQQRYFLRFSSEQDHSIEQIQAELDYLLHLDKHGYPCAQPISSINGKWIETVSTEAGTYFGVVFSQAHGRPLDAATITVEQATLWGASLASLHAISQSYEPSNIRRRSVDDVLQAVQHILLQHPSEQEAMRELEDLRDSLHSLPVSRECYGLIHYDFELDNVLWNEQAHRYEVIDFDDSMYHWFGMDIVSAIRDLTDLTGANDPAAQEKIDYFLQGYRSILPLTEDTLRQFPLFQRFEALFGFSRLLWALENSNIEADAVPEWYEGLKTKLEHYRDTTRLRFS
ncbi:phosphotransferase enzyme family protein [Paenibacillus marinisediminis]